MNSCSKNQGDNALVAVQDGGQAAVQSADQVGGRDVAVAQAVVQVEVQGAAQAVAQAAVRAVIHDSLSYLDHIEAVQAVTQEADQVNVLEAVQAVVQEVDPAIQEVVQVQVIVQEIVQAAVSDVVPAAARVAGQVVDPADVNELNQINKNSLNKQKSGTFSRFSI